HRHDRIAAKYDDANVRHALVADLLEQRREAHHVLDDHHVLNAAEAELTVDRVRQMMREMVRIEQRAADRAVARAAAPGDDDDTVARAAVRRLQYELRVVAHDLGERANVVLRANHAIQRRHRDARRDRELFGLQLVVYQGIAAARIEAQDVIAVALVQPEHAFFLQAMGAPEDHDRLLSACRTKVMTKTRSAARP